MLTKLKAIKHHGIIIEIILFIFLILVYSLQCYFKLNHINFSQKDIIDTLAFPVAILTLYGIFIAFLQFLIENNKGFYLGVSKIKFLVDNSILAQCIKSIIFFIMLIAMIGIPIVGNRCINENISIEYLWQACCFIVLIIYICLLKFTFKMVFNLFNAKSSADFKKIQMDFKTEFVKAYKGKIETKFIVDKLSMYIDKMKIEEIDNRMEKFEKAINTWMEMV